MLHNEDLEYNWLHTPTGISGKKTRTVGEVKVETESYGLPPSMLCLINRWNKLGEGKWVYWLD